MDPAGDRLGVAPVDMAGIRDMLHDAMHEMAVVNALAAAIEAEGSCSDEAVVKLRHIQTQTVAVADMLREVFLSRLGRGPVQLEKLLEEVAATSGTRDTRVVVGTGAPEFVQTNEVRLRRALRNLIDNASRAAGPDGRIDICAHVDEMNNLVLSVDDSGPGFGSGPPGVASAGLPIVSKLILEAGGSLSIEDSVLGGARVVITLPGLLFVEAGGIDGDGGDA